MRSRAVWWFLALGACAPAAQSPKPVAEEAFVLESKDDPTSAGKGGGGQSVHEAAIQYLPGRTRFPAVHGRVRGKSTWMLLDTGASANFVSDWLASRIFEDDHGATASDHAGRNIRITSMDQPRLEIDGWGALRDASAHILHDESRSESDNVGVTMSPQTLSSSGVVVIDFPHKRLAMMHARSDAESAMPPESGVLATAQYCRGVYILPAKLGDATARML
ncbi:MAG: aspartyl protease family protein, partial [Polyangiaceae bacterium]